MRAIDQLQVAMRLLAAMRSQWWSARRIREYQEGALVRVMRHAATQVPFYQRLNLHADTIAGAADLKRFPVISKRQVQQDPEAFMAAGFAPAKLYASRTSGSSGQPTTTYFDRRAWLLAKYVLKMRRIAASTGVPLLRRVMIISEQAPERLGSLADAAPSGLGVFFQQRHLSIHTPIEQHLAVLQGYRPHVIYAFPSYLLDLITTAERRATPVPKIATLYTSSEVLTPAARSRIETAFSGRLYDVYGSTEFKEVAWQCGEGRYHLNFESVYIDAPEQGTHSAVVLSTLCNYAMPLLRFDIGDRAVFGSDACPCGRASSHMIEFMGREGDMIVLPSQRRLSPYLLTTAIESESSILQYRIVQTEANAMRIDVIVRSPGQSAAWRQRVCAELDRVIGEPVRLEVREVNALKRDPSGKRSVFVRSPAGVG
jgi:phenylacetate-CoA ligase